MNNENNKKMKTLKTMRGEVHWIKCLDLDDTNGQLKLEGWLYIGFLIPFSMRRHHFIGNLGEEAYFIGNFGEEALFCWLFERGGPIYLVNWGGG